MNGSSHHWWHHLWFMEQNCPISFITLVLCSCIMCRDKSTFKHIVICTYMHTFRDQHYLFPIDYFLPEKKACNLRIFSLEVKLIILTMLYFFHRVHAKRKALQISVIYEKKIVRSILQILRVCFLVFHF